mmetsp:Transcript_38085/g.91422  ORF Transcript_38085/g.91422 Transcript_38085/m.91422 type:complete len:339 (+) Transcript_38085:46-1062(+)
MLRVALTAAAVAAAGHAARPRDVVAYLQQAAARLEDPALEALAQEAAGAVRYNPEMDKVKDMLRGMLDRAMDSQTRDVTQDSFCKKELPKAQQTAQKRQRRLEKTQADVDMIAAKIEKNKLRITDLSTELSELAKAAKDQYAARQAEKAKFEEESKRYDDAEYKLDQAMQVVRRNNNVLLQKRAHVHRQPEHWPAVDQALQDAKSLGTPKTIPALEDAQAKNFQNRVKAKSAEADAEFKFEKLQKDQKEAKEAKEKEIKELERDNTSLKTKMFETKTDVSSVQAQLAAGQEYLEQLKKKCVTETSSAKERNQRREQQIESLKEAHRMLSGEEIPVFSG